MLQISEKRSGVKDFAAERSSRAHGCDGADA